MTSAKDAPPPRPPLTCSVCLREIPPEVELTEEGREYVHYFCGLDCYRAWQERAAPGKDADRKPKA